MAVEELDAALFKSMINQGAENLTAHVEMVNALNVFPVPDGDTGTNMNLTITSGQKETAKADTDTIAETAKVFSKGLLMGARGNSGVILSQLFRGFSRHLSQLETIDVPTFAAALQHGVETAYKSVIKPVEGTILTVAKDVAEYGVSIAQTERDFTAFLQALVEKGQVSLNRTPELLPVLKEVGVVDSGGQGLLLVYEGFLAGLSGQSLSDTHNEETSMSEMINAVHHKKSQLNFETEEITYGYCTEFMVNLQDDTFVEDQFRETLTTYGDSLLVVSHDDVLKVHIHTEQPGDVLSYSQAFGALRNIKIDNMREQHEALKTEDDNGGSETASEPVAEYALITICSGEGMTALFKSMGATQVIEGGQTMNPSTQDLVDAIDAQQARHIFLIPNNGNIIMTAHQAADITDKTVTVIPTKTIPEGMAALMAFHPDADAQKNGEQMLAAREDVKSGQITYAIRDTSTEDLTIKKGDYIGIADGQMVTAATSQLSACKQLLNHMVDVDEDSIITVIAGEDAQQSDIAEIEQFLDEKFEDIDIEMQTGQQPVYAYIISVES